MAAAPAISFDGATATWTWLGSNRLVSDTWLQVQVQPEKHAEKRQGPAVDLTVMAGGGWRSSGCTKLSKVKAAKSSGEVVLDGELVRIPFWDKAVHKKLFGGLEAAVQQGQDVTLRLSIYGGQGQSNIAVSEWVTGLQLLHHAAGCRPQKTAAAVNCSNSTANASFPAMFTSRNAANAAAGDAAVSEQGAEALAPAEEDIIREQTGQPLPLNPRKRLGTVLARGFDEGAVESVPEGPGEPENSMLLSRKRHAGQQQDQLSLVSIGGSPPRCVARPDDGQRANCGAADEFESSLPLQNLLVSTSGPQIHLLQDAPSESSQGSEVNGVGPVEVVVPTKRTAAVITADATEGRSGQLAAAGVEAMAGDHDDEEDEQAIVDDKGALRALLHPASPVSDKQIERRIGTDVAAGGTGAASSNRSTEDPVRAALSERAQVNAVVDGLVDELDAEARQESADPAPDTPGRPADPQLAAVDPGALEVEVNRRGLTRCDNSFSSRYKGVSWCKPRKKWMAQVHHGGNIHGAPPSPEHLGFFATEEEAKAGYDARLLELGRDPDTHRTRSGHTSYAIRTHLVRDPDTAAGTSSAFRGVSWHKTSSKWRASITVGGKTKSLGLFEATARGEVDAALAYDAATRAAGRAAKANFEQMPQQPVASPDPAPPSAAPAAPAALHGIVGSNGPAAGDGASDPLEGVLAAEVERRGLVRRRDHLAFTSRHAGVSWDKTNKKWQAEVYHGGTMVPLGYFATEAEAKARRDACRLQLGREPDDGWSSSFRGVSGDKIKSKWKADSIDGEYFEGTVRGEVDAALAYDAAARAAGRPHQANFETRGPPPGSAASSDAPEATLALDPGENNADEALLALLQMPVHLLLATEDASPARCSSTSPDSTAQRVQSGRKQPSGGAVIPHRADPRPAPLGDTGPAAEAPEEDGEDPLDAEITRRGLVLGTNPGAGTSSAFRGVSWHKHSSKWCAQFTVGGKQIFLGCFEATARGEVDAALAYDAAARAAARPQQANFEPIHAARALDACGGTEESVAEHAAAQQRAKRKRGHELASDAQQRQKAAQDRALARANSVPSAMDETCTICMDLPAAGTTVRTLACTHKFCANCLQEWWATADANSCPTCRKCFAGLRSSTVSIAEPAPQQRAGVTESAAGAGRAPASPAPGTRAPSRFTHGPLNPTVRASSHAEAAKLQAGIIPAVGARVRCKFTHGRNEANLQWYVGVVINLIDKTDRHGMKTVMKMVVTYEVG
jgi:hypothetical protein